MKKKTLVILSKELLDELADLDERAARNGRLDSYWQKRAAELRAAQNVETLEDTTDGS